MKKWGIIVVILLLVIVGGYLGRHKIKSLFMGTPTPTPVHMMEPMVVTPTATSTSAATTSNIYLTKTSSTKGQYLTDFNGMTLYTYGKDTKGVSNCTGGCLTAWPPYTSGATAETNLPTNITVITRSDGSKQFAWKGMPLYYFASDQKAGDLTGDGVGGFSIVKPL